MIWGDQACMIIGPAGEEGGWYEAWNDAADLEACALRGRIVQVNSDPENVFADFGLTPAEVAAADALAVAHDGVRAWLAAWRAGTLDSEDLAALREAISV